MLEDCLSEGYFFRTNKDLTREELTIVRCSNPEGGYRGIAECLIASAPGDVIPVDFAKKEIPPERRPEIQQRPDVICKNFVHNYEHGTDAQFAIALLGYGASNSAIVGHVLQKGDCFVKASMISAIYRAGGIPTRVIGFREYPKEAWESICADYQNSYSFEEPRISDIELGLRESEPEVRELMHTFGSLANVPDEKLKEMIAKPRIVKLNPEQPLPNFPHCWVEIMRNGQVERYNPNHEDFGFHKLLYGRSVDYAKVFPEVHVDKNFKCRWKDLSFEGS